MKEPDFDLNSLGMREFEENARGILTAFPRHMLVIVIDSGQFRAAILDRPSKYEEPSSSCRGSATEAVSHLHEKLVATAAGQCSLANEHLSKLMTRVIPKTVMPRQSEEKK